MRVITFKERFVPLVRNGDKRQTIRKSAGCRVGDLLSLRHWIGKPRRRNSKQEMLRQVTCTGVRPVVIGEDGVTVGGEPVPEEAMARSDGFADYAEMKAWFGKTHGLPFSGFLIQW